MAADRYAVFGNPIEHSKSPYIHASFARQTEQDIDYRRQLVEVGKFAIAARDFFAANGHGLNITVPFKLDAYAFATKLTARARLAGAVNTLTRTPAGMAGDNTDGVGLLRDLRDNLGWHIPDSEVLVLGAGGAVRGILGPLLDCTPRRVVVANRTASKAAELATLFAGHGGPVAALEFEALAGCSFDIIINGTSASIDNDLPPLPAGLVKASSCCYDMMYRNRATVFMRWAMDNGAAKVADGLGMLVEQAAEAFFIWRNIRPNTAPVIAQLRSEMA